MIDFSSLTKDVVLFKYRDALVRLMNEVDFHYHMQKRKIDPIWEDVFYIQTIIKPKVSPRNSYEAHVFAVIGW